MADRVDAPDADGLDETVEVRIEDLDGMPLDWLVAQADGLKTETWHKRSIAVLFPGAPRFVPFRPSRDSDQCDFIARREHIHTYASALLGHGFGATQWKLPLSEKLGNELVCKIGSCAKTHQIAAMRCYCVSRYGEKAMVPKSLIDAWQRDVDLTVAEFQELVRLRAEDLRLRQLCCQPAPSRSALDAAATFEVEFGDRLSALEARFDDLPDGTTHISEFYGRPLYYKRTTYQHLNQVCEKWQTLERWFLYDVGDWTSVGPGFSPRRLVDLSSAAACPNEAGAELPPKPQRERDRG